MRVYFGDLYYDQHHGKGPVPLNVAYVAAYCQQTLGAAVDITLFKSLGVLLDAIDAGPPDVLGLSNYIWNERLNAFVASYAKAAKPEALVIMGGPNIRTDRDGMADFLRRYRQVDYYVPYAAEQPTSRFLSFMRSRDRKDRVRGLDITGCVSLDFDDALIGHEEIDPRPDLDYLPSPYLTGWLDPFLKDGYAPLFETNRGCPYSCTFCVWGISALSKVKRFSDERVHAELDYAAAHAAPGSWWSVADANFGILKRDADIAAKIRSIHDANPKLFGHIDVYWAKNPTQTLVDIARELGNLAIGYVAFQSLNDDVLANIKRSNISTERLAEFTAQIRPYVDDLHTDLLVGLPGESKQSHLLGYRKALKMGFTSIGGGEVRMLPGSEMDTAESRARYGLRTKWRISDGDIGVWRDQFVFELEEGIRSTNAITEEEMLELRVIRAILFGSVHFGYLTPVVAAMRVLDYDFVGMASWIADLAGRDTPLGRVLTQLKAMARGEWFETEAAAKRHLENDETRRRLIETPPTKLNFWFIAALILDPAAADEFFATVEACLVADGLAPAIASDLVKLCRATEVLGPVIQGEALAELEAIISPATAAILARAHWLSADGPSRVQLTIPAVRLDAIRAWVDAHRPMTHFNTTIALGRFAAMYLRPVKTERSAVAV